jgi:hypothetical protein
VSCFSCTYGGPSSVRRAARIDSAAATIIEIAKPITPHGGILEHFERVVLFNNLAHHLQDAGHRYRLFLAAIYSCQAIVELMYEECTDKLVSVTREELKAALKPLLPGFSLIEKIRIHDFHRFGITPPIA